MLTPPWQGSWPTRAQRGGINKLSGASLLSRRFQGLSVQLLTGLTFQEGVVGKALLGTLCSSHFSGVASV